MKLPAMPVRSGRDATMNFDKLSVVIPTFVSALPHQPVDGQEVYFQDTSLEAQGVVWRLRYRAGSSSVHKWEFIGGSPLSVFSSADTNITLASAAFVMQDVNPVTSLTAPLAGDYMMAYGLNIVLQTGEANRELDVMLANAANSSAIGIVREFFTTAATFEVAAYSEGLAVGALAKEVFKLRCSGNSITPNGYRTNERFIKITPVRVG